MLSAATFTLGVAASAHAQSVAGKWHVDFGAWVNEDNPDVPVTFVQSGKLTLEVKGDSVFATFLPGYAKEPANAGAPVNSDTLRGTLASGRER